MPIPADIAILNALRMAFTIHSRSGSTLKTKKINPERKTTPRAVCQGEKRCDAGEHFSAQCRIVLI